MRRRALLAASMPSGENNIFPIHINLEKISNEEYRADPTPESIAFCDYFKKNAVFDGTAACILDLERGQLYIDDIEVVRVSNWGSATELLNDGAYWEPYHSRYDNFWSPVFHIQFEERGLYPKGTFVAWDDN